MGMGDRIAAGCLALACAVTGQAQLAARTPPGIADMSLEELSRIRVTSVSRSPEALIDAAASIFVITAEDIRRSGATTLPEALRLAPNLFVARLDAGVYAITSRGFNSIIANKLLVLVDGRTIYSPMFSGVFWEAHDVMLEDVERIEVISGAGGTTWGSNAVNGIINVITRPAKDTQGTLAALQLGNREQVASARYGIPLGADGGLRVYAKSWQADGVTRAGGVGVTDGWKRNQAGFRADWSGGPSSFTLQGDVSSGRSEERAFPGAGPVRTEAANLLGRWTLRHADGAETQLQGYVDRLEHADRLLLDETAQLYDLEARHQLQIGRHRFQVGAGHRAATDTSNPGLFFAFFPQTQRLSWTNVFAQDQIRLRDNLELTLGARMERNSYTGWEFLPSARLGWKLDDRRLLWTALSRAVRAPARLDRAFTFPIAPPFALAGGPDFQSETANVYELGYRAQPSTALSYSVTLFHQRYDHLRSTETGPPSTFQNRAEGEVSGLEAWGYWQATPSWRLSAGFTTVDMDVRLRPGSTDASGGSGLGNDPGHQWMLRSSMSLGDRTEFDVAVRRVGSLPAAGTAVAVPAYTALDLRYAWEMTRNLQLAFVVQHALDPFHRERGDSGLAAEISRFVGLKALWRY